MRGCNRGAKERERGNMMDKEITLLKVVLIIIGWIVTVIFIWHYNITAQYIENGYIQQQRIGNIGEIWVQKK